MRRCAHGLMSRWDSAPAWPHLRVRFSNGRACCTGVLFRRSETSKYPAKNRAFHMNAKDFFDAGVDESVRADIRSPRRARLRDVFFDLRLITNYAYWINKFRSSGLSKCRVLIVAVAVPGHAAELGRVLRALASQRHSVIMVTEPMLERGKFDNINAAIEKHGQLFQYDWIIVTDDDMEIPPGFLDYFLYLATKYNMKIAQPAHRFYSFATFSITKRRWGTLARQTRFVETGPLTAFHRDTFAALLPFPSLRWAWGLDLYWADIARRQGWNIGIIDALPVRHYRPVGSSYSGDAAIAEARQFLAARGVTTGRAEIFQAIESYVR